LTESNALGKAGDERAVQPERVKAFDQSSRLVLTPRLPVEDEGPTLVVTLVEALGNLVVPS
jgi:hypothetical protein